jgi:hypothetical protein
MDPRLNAQTNHSPGCWRHWSRLGSTSAIQNPTHSDVKNVNQGWGTKHQENQANLFQNLHCLSNSGIVVECDGAVWVRVHNLQHQLAVHFLGNLGLFCFFGRRKPWSATARHVFSLSQFLCHLTHCWDSSQYISRVKFCIVDYIEKIRHELGLESNELNQDR